MTKSNTLNRIIGVVIIVAVTFYCIPEIRAKVSKLIKLAKEF